MVRTVSAGLLTHISYNRPLYWFCVKLWLCRPPINTTVGCGVWNFRIILPILTEFKLSHCKLYCGSAMATQTFVSNYCVCWVLVECQMKWRRITIDFHLIQSNLNVRYSLYARMCVEKINKTIYTKYTKSVFNDSMVW